MLPFLVSVVVLFGLLYFLFRRQRRDDAWQSFRLRHRARLRRPVREQTIDPTFQFDPPPRSPQE